MTGPTTFQNFIFRPGGVQSDNVFTNWADLMTAKSATQGWKTIEFDDRIVSPCVIPAGTWDQDFCEWFGIATNNTGANVAVSIGGAPSGGDVILPNLRQIAGKITVTNLNAGSAPIVVTPTGNTRVLFQLGIGIDDGSQIVNTGPAPFFDCTGLTAAQQFLLRMSGQISGAAPAIQFGASPGTLSLALFEARIFAGMIAGTNVAANMNLGIVPGSVAFTRQSAWTGTIRRGIPNQAQVATAAGFTPFVRTTIFPAPGAGETATAPSTVALTPATGLGMNTTMRFNATAGVIAQTLPQIRAAAPAIGAQANVTPGVLYADGMIVVVREFSGINGVNLSPAAGETIEGGAGPLLVPAGGCRVLQTDGISNWFVIAAFL